MSCTPKHRPTEPPLLSRMAHDDPRRAAEVKRRESMTTAALLARLDALEKRLAAVEKRP